MKTTLYKKAIGGALILFMVCLFAERFSPSLLHIGIFTICGMLLGLLDGYLIKEKE